MNDFRRFSHRLCIQAVLYPPNQIFAERRSPRGYLVKIITGDGVLTSVKIFRRVRDL